MNAHSAANPFLQLHAMGYTRLCPIVPIDAALSDRSTLHKRLMAGDDSRGKAPGVKGHDGLWRGLDWLNYEGDEADLERWHAMGAGVGIKTGPQPDGTWLVGVDADTLDERCAALISGQIRKAFGIVPSRLGRPPKALYVLRINGPIKYARVEFDDGKIGADHKSPRVELLSAGRQFVAAGVHPVTRQPYRWAEKLVPFAELPVWSAEMLQ